MINADTRHRWLVRAGLFALVLAAHLAVFAWLGLRTPLTSYADLDPPPAVEVWFLPATPLRTTPAGGSDVAARPGYRPRIALPAPPSAIDSAPSPIPISPAEDASTSSSPGGGEARAVLQNALRRSLVGCANRETAHLTAEERTACDERQTSRRLAAAPLAPLAGVDPAKVGYYAAVQEARKSEGHGPVVGCAIRWGNGKVETPKRPRGGAKLGPCIIGPPAGMLTPEADIAPPGLD